MSRRDFIKKSVLGAGLAATSGCVSLQSSVSVDRKLDEVTPSLSTPPKAFFAAPPIPFVRIGIVGVGGQGIGHVENLLKIPNCQIMAIADINPQNLKRACDMVEAAGFARPKAFGNGERDFERMCEGEALDLVMNATPWEWHVPIMLAAMSNGKHTATEVPAATSIADAWKLVEYAEKYQKHCVMLENCNYDRNEMMVLNMVKKGLFGEVLHAECGYLHDLRAIKFSTTGEGLWRRAWSEKVNGNLYPTHGLGPIANCMDINRGDYYDYLVAMASPSRGLQAYAEANLAPDDPRRKEQYILGDVNTALIKTKKGKTIYISHDTNLPRPYSRIHMLQGTKGIFQGYPHRVHIEGKSQAHRWEEASAWYPDYDHALWRKDSVLSANVGHGGMDYLENYRLIRCLQEGKPTDMNVYDAASMSAVIELTAKSIQNGSAPMPFPDFTRGAWQYLPPIDVDSWV